MSSGRVGGWRLALCGALCLALPLGLVGCGSSGRAPVSGKVTVQGQPVQGGTLVFSPLKGEGKSATAEIKSDGTYTLGTNRPGDGAVVGRHRVTFTPPAQTLTEEQRSNPRYVAPPPLYFWMTATPNEVEVKPGTNTLDLQLVYKQR